MSGSLAKQLSQHLDALVLGPPSFDAVGELPNVVIYPLFPSSLAPDPPDMITLSEGLRLGVRLSDTGMVSNVHVDNPLPTMSRTQLPVRMQLLYNPSLLPPNTLRVIRTLLLK